MPLLHRVARALLRALLPKSVRADVLEDLDDKHREMVEAGRPVTKWMLRQVVGGIIAAMGERLVRLRGDRSGHHPESMTASRTMGGGEEMMEIGPARPGGRFDRFAADARFGLRQLARSPGFAFVLVLTLAIGIGLNTAMFSVVDTVLVRPLPYDDAPRLGYVHTRDRASGQADGLVLPQDVVDMVEQIGPVEDASFFQETVLGPMSGGDHPAHVRYSRVSANMFDLLGVEPILGRGFVPEDGVAVTDTINRPPNIAIISHGLWTRAFGADPDVLGRRVVIWGVPHDIVGVMPGDFELWTPPEMNVGLDMDVWTASRLDYDRTDTERRGSFIGALVRLDHESSFARVASELKAFSVRQREAFVGHREANREFHVTPLLAGVTGDVRSTVWVLFAAVAFVLLIACTNVANLLLARGTTRRTELSVRHALGASRGEIVKQLLVEAGVLASAGALCGIGMAYGTVAAIRHAAPATVPRADLVTVDLRALLITAVAALAATFLAGLVPAVQGVRSAVAGDLRMRGGTGPTRRVQRVLVATEVALSVTLLTGTALMLRTAANLQWMDLGFEPGGVLAVDAIQLGSWEERIAFESESLSEIRGLPGVVSAAAVFPAPMNGVYRRYGAWFHPEEQNDPTAVKRSYLRAATPDYFETVGIDLLQGRDFNAFDLRDAPLAAIVDETLARRHWPDASPVGETIVLDHLWNNPTEFEIVGVVESAPQWDHRDTESTIYVSRGFFPVAELTYVIKTSSDPAMLAGPVRRIVSRLRPEVPMDPYPLSDNVGDVLQMTRFVLVLLGSFAAVALSMAGVGLFAVLAYQVRQRKREIGIRMALGAHSGRVVRAVVSESLAVTSIGLAVGSGIALSLGRALESQLYGVTPMDSMAITGTLAVVVLVSLAASIVPSLRAATVDPSVALEEGE